MVHERAEPVEDGLAPTELDAPQAVVVVADHGVRAVVHGIASQLQLVALQDLDPARVAPVAGDDEVVRFLPRRRDRRPEASEVLGHGDWW